MEACAARLAGQDRLEHRLGGAARDDRGDPGGRGHLRREDLALHSPATELRRVAQSDSADCRAVGDELGVGGSGRTRVHTVDLGEKDEQAGLDEDRDLGGERVVVAEGDLVGRDRVVLVHDRHRAEREELAERVAGVDVRRAVRHVARREENLCGRYALACEGPLPRLLQS